MYLRDRLRDVEAAPAIGSLPHLIAWLETKNPFEWYCWTDPSQCALAQYSKAMTGDTWRLAWLGSDKGKFQDIAYGSGNPRGWTFGAALARARNEQRFGTAFPSLTKRIVHWLRA